MPRNYPINVFQGLHTADNPEKIPEGAASDSLNWLTRPGYIELRRGYTPLGTEQSGAGRISGLGIGKRLDGTEIPFATYAQKIRYYDATLATPDWVEIGSNSLPAAASGEDILFAPYQSLTGAQIWFNSPNTGPYKIMVANPGTLVSQYVSSKNFKGYMSISRSRTFNWFIQNADFTGLASVDKTGFRGSYIDKDQVSDYTNVTSEVLATGDSVTKVFTGTLAFKAAGVLRTCFNISATDGVETFTDTGNGTLTGSAGGSGTINYASGAISLTFFVAPLVVNVTVSYYWEDATLNGIADFTYSVTRTAGQGFNFRQDDGGDFQNMFNLKTHCFCFHTKKIYDTVLSNTDTAATNDIFRDRAGIPYLAAGCSAAEGVYTIDTSDINNPKFVLIMYAGSSPEIKPYPISQELDLTPYLFDKAVVFEWGDYILFACRKSASPSNDTVFVYNKRFSITIPRSKAQLKFTHMWDKLDYTVSRFENYGGNLLGGDSLSNNVYTLFSGTDDNGSNIANYRITNITQLRLHGLKNCKSLILTGNIGPDQAMRVSASVDDGPFVEIQDPTDTATDLTARAFIKGSGDYVDRSLRVQVGAVTLGTAEIGGGGTGIEAYHYERELDFKQGRFRRVKLKFEAIGLGYLSIQTYDFNKLRLKQDKIARKYR